MGDEISRSSYRLLNRVVNKYTNPRSQRLATIDPSVGNPFDDKLGRPVDDAVNAVKNAKKKIPDGVMVNVTFSADEGAVGSTGVSIGVTGKGVGTWLNGGAGAGVHLSQVHYFILQQMRLLN